MWDSVDKIKSETYLAEFQRVFPTLNNSQMQESIQIVRDALEFLIGDQELAILNDNLDVEKLEECLITSIIHGPSEPINDFAAHYEQICSSGVTSEKCANVLLASYFLSEKSAKKLLGSRDFSNAQRDLGFFFAAAKQLSLLFFSGTLKVDKYAH